MKIERLNEDDQWIIMYRIPDREMKIIYFSKHNQLQKIELSALGYVSIATICVHRNTDDALHVAIKGNINVFTNNLLAVKCMNHVTFWEV